jgi:hypothetical protein
MEPSMKRFATFTTLLLAAATVSAEEGCYDKVEIGDPIQHVIEHCGEPQRRERDIYTPVKSVEVIRGTKTLQSHPVQPQRMEKWYYDTSRNKATLIEIQDGGVLNKRRLEREEYSPAPME